ncbi:MAG TPA: hypothetical protein VI248_11470 [Kineosporiaceae bacterium]
MHTTARRATLAVLMLGIGLIHLLDLPGKWEETRWMGVAYLGLIAATIACAELLLRRDAGWPLAAAGAVATGPLAGFILTRTTGLPGATDDIGNWGEPLGLASLFTEIATLLLIAAALAAASRKYPDGAAGGTAHSLMPAPRASADAASPASRHASGA